MSDDANWLLQVSLKTQAGSLINARGLNRDELATSVTSILELVPLILQAEQAFTAGGTVAAVLPLAPQQPAQPAPNPSGPFAPPANAAPNQQWGQSVQQPARQAPQRWAGPAQPPAQGAPGPVPNCNHGVPAKWVAPGISKSSGKPYRGFHACSFGRDDDCGFKA